MKPEPPPRPLAGLRIVITRAAHQSEGLAAAFAAAGARVELLPLLEVVPPADPGPLERAAAEIARFDWLVLTSANAVEALLPRAGGKGRVMAMEILIPSSAIRNLIREDKVHQIYGMMQAGQAKYGMQTFNQSLASLYFKRMITLETALSRSSLPDELQEIIARGPASLNPSLGVESNPAARS